MSPASDSPWRPASRARFERWFAEMDQVLTGFGQWGLPVDFSAAPLTRAALDQLQEVIRSRFPGGAADVLDPDADRVWIDGAVRYIGQTLLGAAGGRWHYDPSPEALDPGRPIIVVNSPQGPTPISVFGLLVRTAAEPERPVLTGIFDRFAAESSADDQTSRR